MIERATKPWLFDSVACSIWPFRWDSHIGWLWGNGFIGYHFRIQKTRIVVTCSLMRTQSSRDSGVFMQSKCWWPQRILFSHFTPSAFQIWSLYQRLHCCSTRKSCSSFHQGTLWLSRPLSNKTLLWKTTPVLFKFRKLGQWFTSTCIGRCQIHLFGRNSPWPRLLHLNAKHDFQLDLVLHQISFLSLKWRQNKTPIRWKSTAARFSFAIDLIPSHNTNCLSVLYRIYCVIDVRREELPGSQAEQTRGVSTHSRWLPSKHNSQPKQRKSIRCRHLSRKMNGLKSN